MNITSKLYPEITAPKFNFIVLRQCVFYLFVSAFILSMIANIILGGKPWCLYALFSEYIFYTRCMTWDLVETGIIKRAFAIVFPICSLLVLIEILEPSVPWSSQKLIPLIYFALLALASTVYFLWFNDQKTNLMPLLHSVTAAMISLLIGMIFIGKLSVELMLFSGLSIIIIIISMIWYRKTVISEIKKKFRA
ncbi:MAG: DUF6320 domain-containing protein [Clostridia bacterium]